MKAIVQLKLSFKIPWTKGITAPPTIAVARMPEPCVLKEPNPSTESENIMANITELQKPTEIILHTAIFPEQKRESTIQPTAIIDVIDKINDGLTDIKK